MSAVFFLEQLPFFKTLSRDNFNYLMDSIRVLDLRKKTIVFSQGDEAEKFYIVKNGWVKLYQGNPNGNNSVISLLTRGDSFGDAAIMNSSKYLHMAETLTNAKILEIPITVIQELSKNNNYFSDNLIKVLSYKIQALQLEKAHIDMMTAAQRISCFLLQISIGVEDGKNVKLPYDKGLVAAKLGMKSETFSRAIKSLQKYGVEVISDNVIIQDKSLLENYACIDCPSNMEDCFFTKKSCGSCH